MPMTFVALLFILALAAEPTGPVVGVVVDSDGRGVPNASVRLEIGGRASGDGKTDAEGRFAFAFDLPGDVRLTVTAPGFAPAVVAIEDRAARTPPITLELTRLFEEVQVTPAVDLAPPAFDGSPLAFAAPPLRTRAAMTVDDALKIVPGFMLGRRTSSRIANPESQGLTFRGLGGASANRSAVVTDGVPVNDAFAGWVSWAQVPQTAIDRIEVWRGGDRDALGGSVQILTIRPSQWAVRALVEGGSLGTGRVSLFGGGQRRGWSVSGAGEWFTIDGYVMVPKDERGPIDTTAGSTHRSAYAAVGYQPTNGWRVDVRGNFFSEDRRNGTPRQVNDTRTGRASGEVAGPVGGGFLSTRLYSVTQRYAESFSVISDEPPRVTEDLSRVDRVPTEVVGGSVEWAHPFGRHTLVAGADGRAVTGSATMRYLALGRDLRTEMVDGNQQTGAAFARAIFAVSDRLTFVTSARGDVWISGSDRAEANRRATAISPRASLAYRLTTGVTVRGAVYRAFRAPTLNELYRGFRVGNNVIEPNQALQPETLTASEGSVTFTHGRASARITGFWNTLEDAVIDATQSTSPSLNVRRRENAGALRSKGVEFEGAWRLPQSIFVGVTGALTDSRFMENSRLANFFVPQVPGYSTGLTVRYDNGVWVASGQLRVTGPQFEDDVNSFTLGRATVVDHLLSRTLGRRLNVFGAVENAFDSEYDVGRTPVRTVGLPRTLRAGVQMAW